MAFKRSKRKIKETLKEIQMQSDRKVNTFTIGKTYARTRKSVTFDPMRPSSWRLDSGINGRWKNDYEKQDYDGLVVIGCIVLDIIPEKVRKNISWIDQEKYALGLEQSLIQYYTLHMQDARIGNKSFNTGGDAKSKPKSGIIYMAYKLEKPKIEETEKQDGKYTLRNKVYVNEKALLKCRQADMPHYTLVIIYKTHFIFAEITEECNLTVGLEILKKSLLTQRQLVIRREYSSLDDSLFRACSDQLKRIEFRLHHNINHESLKSAVLNHLKLDTEESLSREDANALVDEIEQSKNVNSNNILIDILAKFINRKIIVYTRSDNIVDRSSNDGTTRKSPPLLLAKDDLYYHSLGERKDENTSELNKILNSAIKRKSDGSNIQHENNAAKKSKEINWADNSRDSNLVGTSNPSRREFSVDSVVTEWQDNEPIVSINNEPTVISDEIYDPLLPSILTLKSIQMDAGKSVTAFFVLRTEDTIWYKTDIDPHIKTVNEYYDALMTKANTTRSTDIAHMPSSVESIFGKEFYKMQKLELEHEFKLKQAELEMKERLEMEKKEKEDEFKLKELEMKERLEMEKKQGELKLKQAELEMRERLEMEKIKTEMVKEESNTKVQSKSEYFDAAKNIRLVPKFCEKTVDKYFSQFEKIANNLKWPMPYWTTMLQSVLEGKAVEIYSALPSEKSSDYDTVKQVVLKAYELVPEAYRQKFRSYKKFDSQPMWNLLV
ncbi:Hypothetical predicted protein [Mytilus galloprovincialis]|uniref:Uncharacterized protein n=1 Tax=Mytilus galloprovincialis TaxID=29158 RepID=A0A8B6E7B5_MYTGA|nr:Hypothetical predicted protein [Mytilus galloprovincialis]